MRTTIRIIDGRFVRALLSTLLVLSAAACAQTGENLTPVQDVQAPTAKSEQKIETARRLPRVPEAPIDVPSVSDLTGLAPTSIEASLGTASFIRRDIGSELWHYRTKQCVLFLFLYEQAGTQRVKHIQSTGATSTEECITSIVKTNASNQTS